MARKRIGEVLLEWRVLTAAQLEQGLLHQRTTRQRLGTALVEKGFITEDQLAQVLGAALGIPVVKLESREPDWAAVHLLRPRFCETHDLFPFELETTLAGRKRLWVAMADPLNMAAVEEIEFTLGLTVALHVCTQSSVRTAIRRHYYKAAAEGPPGVMTLVEHGQTREVSDEPEEEPLVGEELPVDSGAQERTSLAALISQRQAQVREKRKSLPKLAGAAPADLSDDLAYLFGGTAEDQGVERLERKFWALMRIMAQKGLITREEFLEELDDD